MPVELKRKPPEPSPHGHVQSAGKQEDFFAAGIALAGKLGWVGDDPELLGNDITVEDARGFIIKTLHEHHIAGATNQAQPDPAAACEHLGLTDAGDCESVAAALREAFESGNGAIVTHHPIVYSSPLAANVTLKLSDADSIVSGMAAGKV